MKEDVEPINLNSMTKRQIFFLCGKLVGHYPVAGWLQVASSFVKRGCQGNAWDSFADRVAIERLKEVLTWLKADDPVKGVWSVPPTGVTNISPVALQLQAPPKVSARAPAHRSYHFRGVKLKSCIKKIHHNLYIPYLPVYKSTRCISRPPKIRRKFTIL